MDVAKSRVARGYTRSAPYYDALASHSYLIGIRRLLPRLRVPPYAAILDVGSGTGINLLAAAQWFAPTRLLCGIDLSPGMVQIARSKAHRMGVPAQFTVGDAERLPYPDKLFDLVICNSVFHWFKDRSAAMREMARVLRPGGQLALICASAPGFKEWFGVLDGVLKTVLGPSASAHMPQLPSMTEVGTLMQANSFLVEHLANPIQPQLITEPESFIRLMATVAPQWTADLTPEAQATVERLAAGVMRMGWPLGFPNTWSALEAVGTKFK